MGGVGAIIYPVIIGYLSLVVSRSNRYRYLRISGSRLVLHSAVEGFLAYALVYWTVIKFVNWLFEWEISFDSFEMFTVCFLILVAIQFYNLIRIDIRKTITLKDQKEGALILGDYIEYLVVDAITNGNYVEIVLKNREVFVGQPIHNPERTVDDTSIAIVPARIGFKSDIDFVTHFRVEMIDSISKLKFLSKKIENKNSDQRFAVAISKEEIVYITTHDKTMYEAFVEVEKKAKKK